MMSGSNFSTLVVRGLAVVMVLGFSFACSDSVFPQLRGLARPDSSAVMVPTAKTYFGMHIHRADAGTPWPDARFGSWRLWDAYAGWPDLQPERGRWNFGKLDKYVAMAEVTGTEILLPLGRSPRWASSRPDERSAYGPGQAAEPRDIEDWRDYVRTVATRYKGRIRAYEVWNEPNDKGFFTGTPEAMLVLQKEAYRIVKEVDPANLLVMPAAVHAHKWLDAYLALGGGAYADVIGYHFYVPREPPEAMLREVEGVRALMRKHGVGHKPIWNTETGWWIANSDGTPEDGGVASSWKRLLADEAAAYVARALILGRWAGLERFYWYAWDNRGLGLIEPGSKQTKQAGRAYAVVADWLIGKRQAGCESLGPVWQCAIRGGDDEVSWLVWSLSGVRAWEVPIGWRAESVQGLNGVSTQPANPSRIAIGIAPVRVNVVRTDFP